MIRFIGGALLLLIAMHANAALTIELRAQARQSSAMLSLGDIATINGDKTQLDVLKALSLPSKGRVGDTVVYSRAEIMRHIFARYPSWNKTISFRGVERVLVRREGQQLAADKYIAWAEQALLESLPAKEGRITVRSRGVYRDLLIPVGFASAKPRIEYDGARRNATVKLDIAVDGEFYASVPVIFTVQRFGYALVLTQAGNAHQHLRAEMAVLQEVDITPLEGNELSDPQKLEGKRLRHDMAAGTPLGRRDIEDCPAVERGDEIKVIAKVGRVSVQTQAVAENDGFIGQRVSVRTAKTQEQLMVDVIGDEQAIVSSNQTR